MPLPRAPSFEDLLQHHLPRLISLPPFPLVLPRLLQFLPAWVLLPRRSACPRGRAGIESRSDSRTHLSNHSLSCPSRGGSKPMETWVLIPKPVTSCSLPGHSWTEVARSREEDESGEAGRVVPSFATSCITPVLKNLKEKMSLELDLCWVGGRIFLLPSHLVPLLSGAPAGPNGGRMLPCPVAGALSWLRNHTCPALPTAWPVVTPETDILLSSLPYLWSTVSLSITERCSRRASWIRTWSGAPTPLGLNPTSVACYLCEVGSSSASVFSSGRWGPWQCPPHRVTVLRKLAGIYC